MSATSLVIHISIPSIFSKSCESKCPWKDYRTMRLPALQLSIRPLSYRTNHFDSLFGKITVPSGRVIALIRLFPSESNHDIPAPPLEKVEATIRTRLSLSYQRKLADPSTSVRPLIRVFSSMSSHRILASPSAFVPAPIRTLPLRSYH